MASKRLSSRAIERTSVLSLALALVFLAANAEAGESVILQFDKSRGAYPVSGLVSDSAGNLYGTTTKGGSKNCGAVFELSPAPGGKWGETLLYSFTGCITSTLTPKGTLLLDQAGNLYGVRQGFSNSGELYKLTKAADGTWSETVIHSFGGNEGIPYGDLVWDTAGNIYGATNLSFGSSNGEVFELSPQPDGTWKETQLYKFPAPNGVGFPYGGVVFDGKGNLYGPAFYGIKGSNSAGAVYELSPQANGPWTLTVVYNFTFSGGVVYPTSRLTVDSSGNLYGTTFQENDGQVFELSPTSNGAWVETTIHTFTSGSDGSGPSGTLAFDPNGNLYGTTYAGGLGCNLNLCGTVYKLSPQSGNIWKETILHQFESASDGSQPQEGLFLDSSGNLFGTTARGGSRYGYGTVYKITP